MAIGRYATALAATALAATAAGVPAYADTTPDPVPAHTWFVGDGFSGTASAVAGGAPIQVMLCVQQTGGFEVIQMTGLDITVQDPAGRAVTGEPTMARQYLQSWQPAPPILFGGIRLDVDRPCFRLRLTFSARAAGGVWRLRGHISSYELEVGGIPQPTRPLTEQDDAYPISVTGVPATRPAGPPSSPAGRAGPPAGATVPADPSPSGTPAATSPSVDPTGTAAPTSPDLTRAAVPVRVASARGLSGAMLLGLALAVLGCGAALAAVLGRRRLLRGRRATEASPPG